MCTCIFLSDSGHFFGRNLDIEKSYGEGVVITPRGYTLSMRRADNLTRHYAIIGAGIVSRGYPLYFDGANEHGLAIAGLNFVGNARYFPPKENKLNLASFELIPYVLATCKSVEEAKSELTHVNVTDLPFSRELPPSELHWMISDKRGSIVVEQTENGLKMYDNPTDVLTNNPPFPFHLQNLNNYINLTPDPPENRFSQKIRLDAYSRGMGALGLPGDLSSSSRFVRAAFTRLNSKPQSSTELSISQAFHILSSVEQVEGCVRLGDELERTEYSSVINLDTLTYYYKTYTSGRVTAVRLFSEDIDSSTLISFPLERELGVSYKN